MFTFDLQRFVASVDEPVDDYNLKQGLRNIITSLNSKIEGEYVMASNANMTIDDVVDTIINALQQGGGLLDPNLREDANGYVTWDGDGVCKYSNYVQTDIEPATVMKHQSGLRGFYMLESDGTYAKDWLYIHWYGPD